MTTGKSPFEIVYGIHPRGVYELRDLNDGVKGSGYAKDFTYAMQEVHDIVRKTLIDNIEKIKSKVDEGRKEVHFKVGDLVMVYLNKARLQKGVPHKL